MKTTIALTLLAIFLTILFRSMYELFKPERKRKKQMINNSVRQFRHNRELIKMPDGSYLCQN